MEKRDVPSLRFKGFEDEIKTYKLEEITDYVDYRGKTPTKSESGIFLVTAKNIKKGYIDYNCSKEFISEDVYEDAMRRGKPKLGDVLLTTEAPLGNVAQIDNENIALAQRVIKFRGKENLNNYYLKQYFLSNIFQKTLVNKAIGTTVLGIQGKVLHKINLKIPSLEEQTKIANFLSNVDNIIEEQEGKVKDLEQYKKGMMQKIFKQEVRFKDENGEEYPEWEEKKLGEITIKTGYKNKENKKYIVYSISNKYGFIPQNQQFEDSRLDSLEKVDYKIVHEGDFAYNPARINVGSIGFLEKGNGLVSSLYVCFRFESKMINKFFQQYFSTYDFHKNVLRNVEGGVREYLFYDNFSNIKVRFPCIEEQTKIANFLSNIDNIIEEENKKLEDLKLWKKGLLQQMFV